MWGRHFPSGCCDCHRPFCRWCHRQVISARVSCVWNVWFGVPCCCFWRVACVGQHLRLVSGKWVQSQVGGVPRLCSASPEWCLPKVSSSIFGSLLYDGVYCQASEGCRASRLDDVTFQSSSCHHHRRAVDAVACWGRQQHRGSVASHRCLPQGDW